jgi:hypothetical protein
MEFIVRGYPSRIRFVDWQKANSLGPDALPALSDQQKRRAQQLRIPDRAYAIGLKAAQLARERLVGGELDHLGGLIASAAKKRGAEVTTVVWDFLEHDFKFMTRQNGREQPNSLPPNIIDDLLLGKEGADRRLKEQVDFLLGGWSE